MSAVIPVAFCAPISAGAARSSAAALAPAPLRHAHISAESPFAFTCDGDAPAPSSRSTTSRWPPAAAQKSGGFPLSRVAFDASAPWRSSSRTTAVLPTRAAEMSAVLPAWSRFTAVPRERMRPTSSGASARPEPAMLTRRETSAITYEVCRNFLRSDASALRRVEAP